MENLFESSIIKGFIFSAYGELGPQPVYTWPNYYSEKELKQISNLDWTHRNEFNQLLWDDMKKERGVGT